MTLVVHMLSKLLTSVEQESGRRHSQWLTDMEGSIWYQYVSIYVGRFETSDLVPVIYLTTQQLFDKLQYWL